MSKAYRIYNKRTQAVEETIHISFKEKKKDIHQNVHDREENMEILSLNNGFQNQQSFQLTTRENNDEINANSELSYPQHVFDNIQEDSEESPIKKRYTNVRDLKAISQNQIIGKPYQGIRTKSSFRSKSNMALVSEIQLECIDEVFHDQS